jgi:hypothetical protein
MAVKLGDIVSQAGADTYRLMNGKDLDITGAASAHATLADADMMLVDVAAAGTQASTKSVLGSVMKTYFQSGLSSPNNATITLSPQAGMASMGNFTTDQSGNETINIGVDGVLQDLDSMGVASSNGQFIVATGAGAFQYESSATARSSLGLDSGNSPTFASLTITGDLTVSGDTITTSAEIIEIAANTLILNAGHSGAEPNESGLVVERGSTGDNALLYWAKASSGTDTTPRWEIGKNAEADLATSPDYVADVMQVRIDNAAILTTSTEVPVGHMQYHNGDLYLRVEN